LSTGSSRWSQHHRHRTFLAVLNPNSLPRAKEVVSAAVAAAAMMKKLLPLPQEIVIWFAVLP
jgi:hypothetical protein